MRSRWLLTLSLLLLVIAALSGCGRSPQAQAEPGTITDILPTPPPMPTGNPVAPRPTPPPAPAAPPSAAASDALAADFAAPDLSAWSVRDAAAPVRAPSTWRVSGGRLLQDGDSDQVPTAYPTALLTGNLNWADLRVNAAAYTTGNDEMGVVARAGEAGYYVFRLLPNAQGGSRRVLARYDAADDRFVTLAEASGEGFELERWYQLSLQVQGDQLRAFVDGREALVARDATLKRGQAGVYGYAQGDLLFDNVSIQVLASQP